MLVWVVAVLAFVVGGVVFGVLLVRRQNNMKARQARLEIHRSRMRKVYGCMCCGVELLPDDNRYVCGSCRDEWSYCVPCYEKGKQGLKDAQHRHRMYFEKIRWEVDPAEIKNAKTSAQAFEACFKVYAKRPCLGWRRESDGQLNDEYKWISYREVHQKCIAFSQGKRSSFLVIQSR